MELRSPDPSLNPYLAFALILAAGLEGIENAAPLPPPLDADLYTAEKNVTKTLTLLPDSLHAAITLAARSDFVKSVVGEELLEKYIVLKQTEADEFAAAKDKAVFCKERYFRSV
jgi:glutamine synthetase